ncbi:MAG: hypothetical protein GY799_12470, partial [Desulfobulbaceae bacterium]|nr:hypothetical protein [Desulfobulbaceae bacterium]
DDKLKVQVVPRVDVELPIEVISIIPGAVSLVDSNPDSVYRMTLGAGQANVQEVGLKSKDKIKKQTSETTGGQAVESDSDKVPFIKILKNLKPKRRLIQ